MEESWYVIIGGKDHSTCEHQQDMRLNIGPVTSLLAIHDYPIYSTYSCRISAALLHYRKLHALLPASHLIVMIIALIYIPGDRIRHHISIL